VNANVCTECGGAGVVNAEGVDSVVVHLNHLRDLTRHEWALVITAVVTLAAIAALALIALGKGWL